MPGLMLWQPDQNSNYSDNGQGVVNSMDATLRSKNLENTSALINKFEHRFETLDVQIQQMEDNEIKNFKKEMADEAVHDLNIKLPQDQTGSVAPSVASIEQDELSQKLVHLHDQPQGRPEAQISLGWWLPSQRQGAGKPQMSAAQPPRARLRHRQALDGSYPAAQGSGNQGQPRLVLLAVAAAENPNKVPGHGPDLAQRQSHEEMTMKEEIGKVLLHLHYLPEVACHFDIMPGVVVEFSIHWLHNGLKGPGPQVNDQGDRTILQSQLHQQPPSVSLQASSGAADQPCLFDQAQR
ncbi:hypothetical protein QTO34_020089 [Cnephaeus nilssonii]|uniref:Uncharacterized protein n=1 Tax=Cnephaeus nilssonii TaxID=3371016 RepID=A0AA40LMM6_CNENI|nr:hypothetical protein QTO34_020089 [Eptesicus nilssonii]